jgi:TonB family protein
VRPEEKVPEAWKEWEGQVAGGSFRLQRFLGSGEQSAVFLTQCGDAETQSAAIKLIRAERESAERKLSEWERAAQLSHPHLVRLFQTGICQVGDTGLLYAVMEYGEENLGDVLRDRPLTEAEAHQVLKPALDALAYIHGQGLVHGHLKAANIMAVGDQVKISSDGISKAGEWGGRRGHASVYDPPEFATEGTSAAGDVWSLGMTLVEVLTQHPPSRRGPQQEVVLPETLPAGLLDIARHCMQADPRRRATVADIAARLGGTPSVPEEGGAARPHEASRKWRYAVPVGVAASLALAAIVAGPGLVRRPAPPTAEGQPKAQAEAVRKPVVPEPGQPAESTGSGETGAAPAPTAKGSARLGQVAGQVLPDVPREARNTIRGTVKISVRTDVDASGRVVSAKLDSAGPSKYFAKLTLDAARQWKFRPPNLNGGDVGSEWVLRFELTRTATKVRPVQVSP